MSTFRKELLLIFIGCVLHSTPVISDVPPAECSTPELKAGTCIALTQCPYLLNILRSQNLTDEDRRYLKSSQCGYTNFVWVCCPQNFSSTPESSSVYNVLPRYPDCGFEPLANRIIGGTETKLDEFPWIAQLQYTKSLNLKGIHCGGSLIHKRYVLTAAHCADERDIPKTWQLTAVRLGEWDTTTNPDCDKDECAPKHQDIDIVQIIIHPEYDPAEKSKYHDIALLKLAKEAILSDFVALICLPTDVSLREQSFEGEIMDIAGWGKTEKSASSSVKLKTEVSVWNINRCREAFTQHNIVVSTVQLCAGGKRGIDACRGDSGGPLMLRVRNATSRNANAWYLTGTVSLGLSPCGLENWPGIYVRVGAYVDWIETTINSTKSDTILT